MTEKRSSSQVLPYRRPFRLNVGLIMLLIIFLYVLISLISYLTSHRTEVYEVRTGSLSNNQIYKGIALRRETIINSDYTGTINFYNKEGDDEIQDYQKRVSCAIYRAVGTRVIR